MPELIFHPDIQTEIKESYQWYESKAAGLGEDFLTELESAFQSIREMPDTWPVIAIKTAAAALPYSGTFLEVRSEGGCLRTMIDLAPFSTRAWKDSRKPRDARIRRRSPGPAWL